MLYANLSEMKKLLVFVVVVLSLSACEFTQEKKNAPEEKNTVSQQEENRERLPSQESKGEDQNSNSSLEKCLRLELKLDATDFSDELVEEVDLCFDALEESYDEIDEFDEIDQLEEEEEETLPEFDDEI